MGKRTPSPKRFDDDDDDYAFFQRLAERKEFKRVRSDDRYVKTRSRYQQEDEA